jgi:hypothetical protein
LSAIAALCFKNLKCVAAVRRCGALIALYSGAAVTARQKGCSGWVRGREGGDHVIEQSLSCIVNNDASGMIDCPNAHKMSARCLLKIDDVRARCSRAPAADLRATMEIKFYYWAGATREKWAPRVSIIVRFW